MWKKNIKKTLKKIIIGLVTSMMIIGLMLIIMSFVLSIVGTFDKYVDKTYDYLLVESVSANKGVITITLKKPVICGAGADGQSSIVTLPASTAGAGELIGVTAKTNAVIKNATPNKKIIVGRLHCNIPHAISVVKMQ